jgi:ATP-dependent RNA helicase DeaD
MTIEFLSFNLRPELTQAIVDLGFVEATPIQAEMIPLMMTGVDVIGQAQTGTGKTAAFGLPILHNLQSGSRSPQALIMAPTRELALQVSEAMLSFGKEMRVRITAVYGGAPYQRQINELRRGVDIVVGTPGRLIDLIDKKVLDLSEIKCVVLDEADEMLSMGFVEDIERILSETPSERQTALFSATMPMPIRKLADKYMRDPQSITIQKEKVTVDAIEQIYYLVNEHEKSAVLSRLFEMEPITSALIFVRTRAGTGELASELSNRGFPSEALNGDLNQDARERTLNRFKSGQVKVLVATDVAARGLDIDDISHVFNYDLPDDHEVYVHRIGRTGRAGKKGVAISLTTVYEKRHIKDIERFARSKLKQGIIPTREEIVEKREKELIEQIHVWMARGRCRSERLIVDQLVEDGIDPLEIASVALKIARAEEKQRSIADVNPVPEFDEMRQSRGGRNGRPSSRREYGDRRPSSGSSTSGTTSYNKPASSFSAPKAKEDKGHFANKNHDGFPGAKFGAKSHEAGMVRLSMSIGKSHGIRPADIVGAIAYHADIPGNSIGKIFIEEQHTLVDVPEQFVEQVLAKKGKYNIRKQMFTVEKAN